VKEEEEKKVPPGLDGLLSEWRVIVGASAETPPNPNLFAGEQVAVPVTRSRHLVPLFKQKLEGLIKMLDVVNKKDRPAMKESLRQWVLAWDNHLRLTERANVLSGALDVAQKCAECRKALMAESKVLF
jgi:hypothetical protein